MDNISRFSSESKAQLLSISIVVVTINSNVVFYVFDLEMGKL